MWTRLQELTQTPVAKFLKKIIGDPVQLYAVFLITTVMYYYHSEMNWLYTVLAVFISWVMMRLYDFIAKHKRIGPLTYLVYMFAGLRIVGMITNWGQRSYPISFLVWFLTPQGVTTFSALYTIAIYLLMLGFLTSVVYYFSKIRYRMSMQFLIMLIPLSLYAKEGIQMPAILVIILLASYFLLMIYCRQLHNPEEIRYLPSFQGNVSIAFYVLAFSIVAAIIPKPTLTADREFIENAMSYSTWSDVLMNAISMFTDTTDNSVGTSNNTRTIYYAQSPEALRLRTQTYSYYLRDDSWNVIRDYDYPDNRIGTGDLTYQPRALLQAIIDAAALDPDFAEKYQLSDFVGVTLPEQEKRRLALLSWYQMRVIPSPSRTTAIIDSAGSDFWISETNTFSGSSIRGWSELEYYPDSYAASEMVSPILRRLSGAEYQALLAEAQNIVQDAGQIQLLAFAEEECRDAYAFLAEAQAQDFKSDVISGLADEITSGLVSDLDKARAIERYFTEQGFVYDQAYQKSTGENAEYFLTQSRTGVCYEYATAMVLLCRNAGLPARYVQGYNMSEPYQREIDGREINYLIKVRDAHAFPEVYISGYGWLSFEPTVAVMAVEDDTAENQHVTQWGFVLLIFALLAGLVYIRLPQIREHFFRKKIARMTPQQSAAAIFQHMRRLLRLSDSTTVSELAEHSRSFCPDNALFDAIDVLLYSHAQYSMTSPQLAETYERWQADRALFLKEEAQKRKQMRKAKRKER